MNNTNLGVTQAIRVMDVTDMIYIWQTSNDE